MTGFVIAGVMFAASAAEPADYATRSFEAMSTRVDVVAPADHVQRVALITSRVFTEVKAQMSEWRPGSPLSAVNQAAGREPVEIPLAVRAVVRRGLELGRITGGAFDVTWAALWGLWDFRAATPKVPDAAEIRRRAALVDFREVRLDEAAGTVALPRAGMKLGLGGIAKGHALEVAAGRLSKAGLSSFAISAGGQIVVAGGRGGRPWRVGIRDPRGPASEQFATIEIVAGSVSTSGDYERFFVRDGVRYHHILDPRTGWPSRGVRSAPVVADDATLAAALSTALMVLGVHNGLPLAERLAGVDAVMVADGGKVHVTTGLRDRLVHRRAPRR